MAISDIEPLFDDFAGAREYARWYLETKRLGGFEIDHQFVVRGCLHRQISRFFALEYTVDIVHGTSVLIDSIRSKGNQSAIGNKATLRVNCGYASSIIRRRLTTASGLPVTIRPAFAERAKAVRASSILLTSRTLIGCSSTPNDGATA